MNGGAGTAGGSAGRAAWVDASLGRFQSIPGPIPSSGGSLRPPSTHTRGKRGMTKTGAQKLTIAQTDEIDPGRRHTGGGSVLTDTLSYP